MRLTRITQQTSKEDTVKIFNNNVDELERNLSKTSREIRAVEQRPQQTQAQPARQKKTESTDETVAVTETANSFDLSIQPEIDRATQAEQNLQNAKQDNLTPGENISIENNVISAIDTIYDDTGVKQLIANEASRAAGAEQNLQTQITNEANRATYAETNLQTQIDGLGDAIDDDVVTDAEVASDSDSVSIIHHFKNLKTGLESQSSIAFPVASPSSAGYMDSVMFVEFAQHGIDIEELKQLISGMSRTVVAAGLGSSPSQTQLTNAFNAVYQGAINPADKVLATDNKTLWAMDNYGTWLDVSTDDISLASEAEPGLAKHSASDGCVGYYVAGVGQVNGWSDLKAAVQAATANIASLQTTLNSHVNNTSNPHSVTKAQVGLGNVPNLDTTNAVNNQHTHSNKSVLDAVEAAFKTADRTKLDGIEAGAQKNLANYPLSGDATGTTAASVVNKATQAEWTQAQVDSVSLTQGLSKFISFYCSNYVNSDLGATGTTYIAGIAYGQVNNASRGSQEITIYWKNGANVSEKWYRTINTSNVWQAWKKVVDTSMLPTATTTAPKMDGTAAVGSETAWAKGDHVHPSDTGKAPANIALVADTGTGTDTATPAVASNTVQTVAQSIWSKIRQLGNAIAAKFTLPSGGTTAQYINGTGALAAMPTSLPPSGPAGGDLANDYPNPTIANRKILTPTRNATTVGWHKFFVIAPAGTNRYFKMRILGNSGNIATVRRNYDFLLCVDNRGVSSSYCSWSGSRNDSYFRISAENASTGVVAIWFYNDAANVLNPTLEVTVKPTSLVILSEVTLSESLDSTTTAPANITYHYDRVLGTSSQFVKGDGSVGSIAASDVPSLDASKITTGTFADARIASAAAWNGKQDSLSSLNAGWLVIGSDKKAATFPVGTANHIYDASGTLRYIRPTAAPSTASNSSLLQMLMGEEGGTLDYLYGENSGYNGKRISIANLAAQLASTYPLAKNMVNCQILTSTASASARYWKIGKLVNVQANADYFKIDYYGGGYGSWNGVSSNIIGTAHFNKYNNAWTAQSFYEYCFGNVQATWAVLIDSSYNVYVQLSGNAYQYTRLSVILYYPEIAESAAHYPAQLASAPSSVFSLNLIS